MKKTDKTSGGQKSCASGGCAGCGAMRCDAMRCDAMRCDGKRQNSCESQGISCTTQLALWLTAVFMVLCGGELGVMSPIIFAFAIFLAFFLVAYQVVRGLGRLCRFIRAKKQAQSTEGK